MLLVETAPRHPGCNQRSLSPQHVRGLPSVRLRHAHRATATIRSWRRRHKVRDHPARSAWARPGEWVRVRDGVNEGEVRGRSALTCRCGAKRTGDQNVLGMRPSAPARVSVIVLMCMRAYGIHSESHGATIGTAMVVRVRDAPRCTYGLQETLIRPLKTASFHAKPPDTSLRFIIRVRHNRTGGGETGARQACGESVAVSVGDCKGPGVGRWKDRES